MLFANGYAHLSLNKLWLMRAIYNRLPFMQLLITQSLVSNLTKKTLKIYRARDHDPPEIYDHIKT